MAKPFLFLCLAMLMCSVPAAWSADFSNEVAPGKWVHDLVPEHLPDLVYPSYFNKVDKAKQQVWTGRYKLAIQTLRDMKPADKGYHPALIAQLKAQALAAVGAE